ncbi:MAG TPA: AAA family ATPase, partial [Nitrospira sp.]|nr:AAA family ATPase [Nitrospira sp.]
MPTPLPPRTSSPPTLEIAARPVSRLTSRQAAAEPYNNILYGPSGVGKTSFAAHFPRTLFIVDRHEKGIFDLLKFNQCPQPVDIWIVDTWAGILGRCEQAALRRDIQHVAIDALSGIELLCFRFHCHTHYADDWSKEGFMSYSQG